MRNLYSVVALIVSLVTSACTDITNITNVEPQKTPETILSAPTDPVMYVQPGQYFFTSVTIIAPVGTTPNVSFGTDLEIRVTGGDLFNYGSVACTSECKTNTWKYTLYMQAGLTEGESIGTFKLEGTNQSSKIVIRRSWKG